MTGNGDFVVVGGGLAAVKAVEGLRDQGFEGGIVLVGEEEHLPYERPPLSKGYLMGNDDLEKVFVHPPAWYADNEVDLRLGSAVTEMDPARRIVTTEEGAIPYRRLLLATGSSVRRLPLADHSAAPVAYLRTIEDSRRIRAELRPGRRIAVIGGGWIGLEVAAAARAAGCDVVLIEALELPLLRVLGAEVARVFAGLHRSHGVDLRVTSVVSSVTSDGDAAVVHLSDGSSVEADLVVVGVGVSPNSALAETGGLRAADGVVVDEHLATSDPDVFAAGDVANAYRPVLHRHVRVEHWDNAIQQGLVAARNMLGDRVPYDRLPYFYTDQYDVGAEYYGNVGPDGYDEVVLRGDVAERVFTAFWLEHGRVVAGMHVNDWDAVEPIRRIVRAGSVDAGSLHDPAVPLETLAARSEDV